jgi:hypothetical protein
MSRPSKRQRPNDGGSSHESIPVPSLEDFHTIHAREGRMRRVGRETLWTIPMERSPQHQHTSDPTWTAATSWGGPTDDPELALDPTGDWYNEMVDGEVMNPTEDIHVAALPKKKRSKVSVSDGYLDLLLQLTQFY